MLQWLSLFGESPILDQLILVQALPLENMCQSPTRELARNNAGFDSDRDLEFAILCMKVRRDVVLVKYRDDYSEKSTNFRHEAKYQNSRISATVRRSRKSTCE